MSNPVHPPPSDVALYTGGPISKQMSVSVSMKKPPALEEDNPFDAGEREHRDEAKISKQMNLSVSIKPQGRARI